MTSKVFASTSGTEGPPEKAALYKMIRKIEQRRGSWINLQADLNMDFSTPQGKKASCRAELVYDRLNEKILLKGINEKKELLFVFKTDDRNFELYLPRQKTNFTGSIFDLEDSPAIHSHLKALDLYRALKPSVIAGEKTSLYKAADGLTRLEVKGPRGAMREIFADASGDAVKEIYSKDGKPGTVLERLDFEQVKKSKKETFGFPRSIVVRSSGNETRLVFGSAHFGSASDPKAFDYGLPAETRRVDVSQEFKKQQVLAG